MAAIIYLISFFTLIPSLASADDGTRSNSQPLKLERLEVQRGKAFQFSKDEVKNLKVGMKEKFVRAFNNSDPEVQKALLKSAKKISEQKALKNEASQSN